MKEGEDVLEVKLAMRVWSFGRFRNRSRSEERERRQEVWHYERKKSLCWTFG